MLHNPYEKKKDEVGSNSEVRNVNSVDNPVQSIESWQEMEKNESFINFQDNFPFLKNGNDYEPHPAVKLRDRKLELTDEEYEQRLEDLNTNAENKHYVIFFGRPASGKTWIIGSVLHYMKNYIEGVADLETEKVTPAEYDLYYQLLKCFNKEKGAVVKEGTDVLTYFELHIYFKPKDGTKPPINIIFVDASGEHSKWVYQKSNDKTTGNLPRYLLAILESNVKTKLAFVYDQSLPEEENGISQVNVLNAIFSKIRNIQNNQKDLGKIFPKALLLSKADRIFAEDLATVEKTGFNPKAYALAKIPSFANSFFNEHPNNKTIFYKIGVFSLAINKLSEFDKDSAERFFNWVYEESTDIPLKPKQTCWDKFKRWFKGEI